MIRILRPYEGARPLRVRLSDLNRYEQGAVLQLDPIHDLHTFNSFSNTISLLRDKLYSWGIITGQLTSNLTEPSFDLLQRIQNLGISDWDVWCKTEEPSIAQDLSGEDWRCMVVDVGTLSSAEQRAVSALAVLNFLWSYKDPNRPVLLVLDEAHNICPLEPSNQMEKIATDYIIRIAGEGSKSRATALAGFAEASKDHPSVLSQCENLVLMRMNSAADLDGLARTILTGTARSRFTLTVLHSRTISYCRGDRPKPDLRKV